MIFKESTNGKKGSIGFTVVELVVVIAVIGILAVITIVSYGAWRHQATAAKVKSDLNDVISAMDSARTYNNSYPTAVPSSVVASSGVVLTGGSADGLSYCVDGTSSDDATITYYVASETKAQGPLSGTCATRPGYQAPLAPTGLAIVTSGYSSLTVSWASVSGATSYTLQCSTDNAFVSNVGQAQSATTSATVSSLQPGSVYYCRAQATSSTGVSGWSTTIQTSTASAWTNLSFQNNWNNYGNTFAAGAYTKTTSGMVVLKGLLQNASALSSSNTVIATLPVGYRPSEQLIFQTTTSPNVASRVDVWTDGTIRLVVGSTSWVALDGINFMPNGTSFNALTPLLNGWVIYGSPWASPGYMTDSVGRVHVKGLISGGSTANGTAMATLPVGSRPQYYMHLVDDAAGAFGLISLDTYGNVVAKGFSNSYDSIQAMFYPSSYTAGSVCTTNWCSLTLQNGWLQHGTGFTPPSYTKASDGMVVVNGLIDSGTTTPGTVIANLPAGYRPKERLIMNCASNMASGRIDIMPNGDIMIDAGISNAWASLDSISFMAEQ